MSQQATKDTTIRWMIRRDMPEVMAIENTAFEFPWSQEDFERTLRQRNCIAHVAERDETIVGFMVYELEANRIILLNMAVKPGHQRTGVGSSMIAKLTEKLSKQRRQQIWLDVRETNLPAQKFFRGHGFRAAGILRGIYDGSDEDAYRMVYSVGQCEVDLVNRLKFVKWGCQ